MKKSQSIIQKTNKIIGKYQILKKIGKGLTAQVYQARSNYHGKVSIKSICPNFYKSKLGQQLIKNEIKLLAKLNHKNVLRLIQKIQENDKVYIVTGFCQGGDLQSYLKKHQKLDERKTVQLLKQIVEGCLYLRSQQIIHRDIKLSNIFLKSEVPVLADFGFAVYENDNNLMKINAGSPLYMPKQSLTLKQFSQKSDVFAIGICLFQMLTGKSPWNANTQKQLIQNLKTPPMLPKILNKNITNLILQCLSVEPNNRPTFKQILNSFNHIQSQLYHNDKKLVHLIQIAPENKGDSKTKQIPSINKNKRISSKQIEIKNKQNIQIKITTKGEKMRSITTYYQSNFLNNIFLNQQNAANKTRKPEDFLSKLNPDQFKFLPQSVITKFKLILHHYKNIIGKQRLDFEKPPILQDRDTLIEQVIKCNTQPQLCKSIQNFIGRLFRLTKNYKQYPHCLDSLEQLYERVITINT